MRYTRDVKKILIGFVGFILGIGIGYLLFFQTNLRQQATPIPLITPKKEIVGFLPYWLLNRAKQDYADQITTLTYFGLSIGEDGNIVKLANPQEEEPGWHALSSGKLQPFFDNAKKNNVSLSLLLFSGVPDAIEKLVANPTKHAKNLVKDVSPILTKYGFSDVNLDIEYTGIASPEARLHFSQFINTFKSNLATTNPKTTITIDVATNDAIKPNLIDTVVAGQVADHVVLMAYDYHFAGSYVSGPIAPVSGAGITSEYDVISAVQKLQAKVPKDKILLGIPNYGYEWETLDPFARAATIPRTGVAASNKRAEDLLDRCATCSATPDIDANEMQISYLDPISNTYHQIFYPTKESTAAKVHLAKTMQLGGIAVWALGYEGKTVMDPLAIYKTAW